MNGSMGNDSDGSGNSRRSLAELRLDLKNVIRTDIDRLAAGTISQINFSAAVPRPVDSNLHLKITLTSRRVDDDGTFSEKDLREHHLVLLILESETTDRQISYPEAMAWKDEILPNFSYCYMAEGKVHGDTFSHWYFIIFIEMGNGAVEAPEDFDWIKHRVGSGSLRISLLGNGGHRHPVYERTDFSSIYHSYSESRGRFWDLVLDGPPEESDVARCFHSLSKAVARRGALGDGIRPVSLRWVGDVRAELILSEGSPPHCYSLAIQLPRDSELEDGRYFLRGGLRPITSAEQYSAGEVYRIQEMCRSELSFWASEISCPEF